MLKRYFIQISFQTSASRPSEFDIPRRHSNDATDIRRSRSTGTTPRSSTRKSQRSSLYVTKDTVDGRQHDVSTSSDEEECRIIPAAVEDDYLERLDRKVSEVINRTRLGNISSCQGELNRSNSEHYGPLSMGYNSRNQHHTSASKKSSPGNHFGILREK